MFVPSKKSRFQVFTTQIFIDFDPVVDSKLRGIGANSRVHLHNLPSASWYGFDGFSYHRSLQAQKYKSINEFHGWCSVTALTIGLWDKTIGQTWTKQLVKVWVRGPLVLATNKRTRETRAFLQNVRERREPCLEIGAHALPVVVWHYRSAERKRAPVDMMRSGRARLRRASIFHAYTRGGKIVCLDEACSSALSWKSIEEFWCLLTNLSATDFCTLACFARTSLAPRVKRSKLQIRSFFESCRLPLLRRILYQDPDGWRIVLRS